MSDRERKAEHGVGPAFAADLTSDPRRPELDGIRGLAILMVMAFHYISLPFGESNAGWAVAVGKSMRLLWSGVDLFFVLSGFLIGGILLKNRGATNYFQVFFVRRFCRIWPLYFFLLLIFIGVKMYAAGRPGYEAFDNGPVPLWSYFVFLQNIFMSIHHTYGAPWLSVTWSLAVEEQFYLVLPCLVYFLSPRHLVYAAVCGILGAVVLRMFLTPDFTDYVNSPTRADAVLCGLLLAVALRAPKIKTLIEHNLGLVLAFVLLGGAGMIGLTFNNRLLGDGLYLWTSFFYVGVTALLSFRRPGWLYRLATLKPLQFTGVISYGLYLFHVPVGWLVRKWLPGLSAAEREPSAILIVAAVSALVTFTAATLCFYLFERRFVRMGHRLAYQRP